MLRLGKAAGFGDRLGPGLPARRRGRLHRVGLSSSVRAILSQEVRPRLAQTSLPFPDDSFDGVWSIWVLEHVPNPEQALRELRRVMRDDGAGFPYPPWNVVSWAAEGYSVRPYSDFGLAGKLIKASIPIRISWPFRAITVVPNRLVRNLSYQLGGPTRLHYRRLSPNYEKYWMSDSDAGAVLPRPLRTHALVPQPGRRVPELLGRLGFRTDESHRPPVDHSHP